MKLLLHVNECLYVTDCLTSSIENDPWSVFLKLVKLVRLYLSHLLKNQKSAC